MAAGPGARGATPVVVVSGGFQSCPATREITPLPKAVKTRFLGRKVEAIAGRLKERGPIRTIYTCYTGLLADLTVDRFDLWISTDRHFKTKEVHSFYSTLFRSADALLPLYRYVRRVLEEVDDPRLYGLGHSYGGWTAAHVLGHFGWEYRASGLVTLDAISPLECKPLRLVGRTLTFRGTKDCLKAPSDLTATKIAPLVASWRNFYQDGGYLLHSGPIPHLDTIAKRHGLPRDRFANTRITRFTLRPHGALGENKKIWAWIEKNARELWY